jgi:uncharacterized protein YbjT (DUF2867 family)
MVTERPRKRVLVAGATGRLGLLADVLLERGHAVRAMTRDPASGAAVRLRTAGAEIVYGDFDDLDSLAGAAARVDAVVATGTAHRAGPDGELRHARNIAGAVASAGVPHLVYTSGDGAAPDSPLALFRVKHEVENYIRSLPITHTILAPVYFMENLFNPWNLPMLRAGVLPSPVAVHLPLQQVAITDLAKLAAIAIERPSEFAGRRIAIASDGLTAVEAAAALSGVTGRDFTAEQLPGDELSPGLIALFDWLEDNRQTVDLAALHGRYPDVGWLDYGAWVRSQHARLRALSPQPPSPAALPAAEAGAHPEPARRARRSRAGGSGRA